MRTLKTKLNYDEVMEIIKEQGLLKGYRYWDSRYDLRQHLIDDAKGEFDQYLNDIYGYKDIKGEEYSSAEILENCDNDVYYESFEDWLGYRIDHYYIEIKTADGCYPCIEKENSLIIHTIKEKEGKKYESS